jgi:hypothetical protein
MTTPDTRTETLEETGTGARDQIRQARDKVVDQAKETFRDARSKAGSTFTDTRYRAAEQLGGLGSAFHRTSETLRTENQARFADLTDNVGHRIDRLSGYLRDSDSRTIARDLEGMARRQPALVFAGAFALGVLAARFLKSSEPTSEFEGGGGYEDTRGFEGSRGYEGGRGFEDSRGYEDSPGFGENRGGFDATA